MLSQMPVAVAPSTPLPANVGLGLADSCITYQLHLLGAYVFFGDLTPTADLPSNGSLVRQLCWDLALSCYYAGLEVGSGILPGDITLSDILLASHVYVDGLLADALTRKLP